MKNAVLLLSVSSLAFLHSTFAAEPRPNVLFVASQPYDETKAIKTTAASTAKRLKHLHHQAQTLGFKLVPA